MDQVNFRARGDAWHLPPGLLGLMSSFSPSSQCLRPLVLRIEM